MAITEWEQTPELKIKVMRARARLMYDQLPVTLGVSIFITLMLTAVLYDGNNPDTMGMSLWWSGVLVVAVTRWVLGIWFKRQDKETLDGLRWANIYAFGAFLSGSILGLGLCYFLRPEIMVVSISLAVLVVLTFGSVVVHAAYAWAHYAYVLPAIIPMVIRCAFFDTVLPIRLMGLLLPVVFLMGLPMAKRVRMSLIETMDSRAERERLIQDLTEQRRLADESRAQAEQARVQAEQARAVADQANAAKTRFFAAASHDLRQPAQAIELFAAALFNDASDDQSRRAATNILSGMRELMGMIESLLDFVRIDTATLVPTVGQVSMAELSMHMRTEFTAQAAKLGLKFRVARCRHTWVQSDRVMLERMVRNLIHNALRYTPSGTVFLGYRREGDYLRIEVHDTGIGIAPEKQAKVFEEFVQLGNPERDHKKGLGLGLAIVSGLSRILDHPIKLSSRPGVGTVFSITVPLVSKPNLPIPELVYVPQNPETANVLVIDDDERVRESMTGLLRSWGYTAKAVDSAALAVQMMENTGFDPDVLLLDYRLRHGLTAIDAVDQIHEFLGYSVPALVMTGNTEPEVKDKLAEHGLSVVYKPVSSVKLREVLATMLA